MTVSHVLQQKSMLQLLVVGQDKPLLNLTRSEEATLAVFLKKPVTEAKPLSPKQFNSIHSHLTGKTSISFASKVWKFALSFFISTKGEKVVKHLNHALLSLEKQFALSHETIADAKPGTPGMEKFLATLTRMDFHFQRNTYENSKLMANYHQTFVALRDYAKSSSSKDIGEVTAQFFKERGFTLGSDTPFDNKTTAQGISVDFSYQRSPIEGLRRVAAGDLINPPTANDGTIAGYKAIYGD